MTIKSSVSFTDRHHDFALRKSKEGQFGSVSSVVAAGIEQLMQDERERDEAIDAMSSAIKDRLATPEADWKDGLDDLFVEVRRSLAARGK